MAGERLPAQQSALADHHHARAHMDSVETLAIRDGAVTVAKLGTDVYGLVGDITEVNSDDAANAGTSVRLARADHEHSWRTGTPAALTKISSGAEGTSVLGSRQDHDHATHNLPWGIMSPRFSSTSNSAAYSAGNTTDFAIADMVVDSTRLYRVHLHSAISITNATTWSVNFHVDATATLEMYGSQTVAGAGGQHVSASALWTPTSGTKDLDIRVATGAGTITFNAAAALPRYFWVEDVGLR